MHPEPKTPKQTLVEAGTEFTGTLVSSCPVIVNGTLDGTIDAPSLSVASSGAIQGTIRANTLRCSGTLAGNIDAGEVFVTGAVRSKTVIRARRLEFKIDSPNGGHLQVTFGTCDIDLPSVPVNSAWSSTTGDDESYGGGSWDLPEADAGSVRAGVASERRRSK